MKQKYSLYIIILLLSILMVFHFLRQSKGIDIEPELLYFIVTPGVYNAETYYSKTELHKDGVYSKTTETVSKTSNGVENISKETYYNNRTHKIEFELTRKIQLLYKPSHGKQLFKIMTEYINDKIVGNSYGFAIGKTNNSIIFTLKSSWHTSNNDYEKLINTIIRPDKNNRISVYEYPNVFGANTFIMQKKYTKIS